MRVLQFIAIACVAFVCAFAPAHAERRVALVVGNNSYGNLPANEQLLKAVNDARSVGGALKRIGFEVITGENLGRSALIGKLEDLVQRLGPGDTAFFFFSGHGVALDGVNYILPADMPDIAGGQETRLKAEALAEPYIISELTGRGVRVAVVVLDACRTNPFSRPGGKGVGMARGLAPPQQVQGVFSLYAAANGQSALDRLSDDDRNPNSVFSRVLVPALTRPGVDLATLAIEVREEVARVAQTAGFAQQPAYYDQTIGGRVYLSGEPLAGGQTTAVPDPAVSDAARAERAERTWSLIQNATNLAVLDDYIRQYGDVPIYGPLARARRDDLAKGQVAVVVPPPQRDSSLTAAQERSLRRGETFRECDHCPEMIVVPAGSFTMGSPASEKDRNSNEGPQHVVTFSQPFAVGKYHVTVDQFAAFVKDTGYEASSTCWTFETSSWSERSGRSWRNPGFFMQEGSHPVICVSWPDAKAYVTWLAKKTGRLYHLLSEAEWEYAARGRTSPGNYPRFWSGDSESELCKYGNFYDHNAGDSNACNDGYDRTSPVGRYQPNAFGLYDMFGNAWQWTDDCWHETYNDAPANGSAWTTGCSGSSARVVHGGSWSSLPKDLRAANRFNAGVATLYIGFRVARTLSP